MVADLYNQKKEKVGTIKLPDVFFNVRWNPDLVHRALVVQMANKRTPIAHAKDRSEVRGGGKKPWRQKGTGRARHGSIRSPIWRGGGVTHGPRKEKGYGGKVNKKEKRKALFSLISKKFSDGEFVFMDALKINEPKTKNVKAIIGNFLIRPARVLFVLSKNDAGFKRASRNLERVKVLEANNLNLYDVISSKWIFMEKDAVNRLGQ